MASTTSKNNFADCGQAEFEPSAGSQNGRTELRLWRDHEDDVLRRKLVEAVVDDVVVDVGERNFCRKYFVFDGKWKFRQNIGRGNVWARLPQEGGGERWIVWLGSTGEN